MRTTPGHETCHHGVYLMTCEEYEDLLARANGRCERCGAQDQETPQGKLQIDHDGRISFGAVRGLLCPSCNTHVGMVDRSERVSDGLTGRYLEFAWYLRAARVKGTPDARMKMRQIRVDPDLWARFGEAAASLGSDRSAVLRDFARWHSGEPGAKLPKRPANVVHRRETESLT